MDILKFNDYIKENFGLKEHDSILIIVDVQKEFGKFITPELVNDLSEYCKEFKEVYQIWDSNKAKQPSFIFPNQKETIKKRYGKMFLDKDVIKKLKELAPEKKEGEIVIIKGIDAQFVRINNNHTWFMVNKELIDLFDRLKGKKVIMVGGGDNECVDDVRVSAQTFGVQVALNHKYIYSADDRQKENKLI